MPDLLRVESGERIDLGDFQHATDSSIDAAPRTVVGQLLTNPNGANRSWILQGFLVTNPAAYQCSVTLGSAIFARRESGQTLFGELAFEGDPVRIVDLATFSNGTYSVYVRFEYIDGDAQNRVFWNPSGLGSEYARSIATRRKANWSVRVELSSPGSEWTKIGEVTKTGAPGLSPVDYRNFYFEGPVQSAYQSGWSTDGGGVANDRNADRKTYGVRDFQTFTAAMRQCLEDIKGRGLRRWWERSIGGMNVGFDANPVEDRLAIGDPLFYLQSTGNPQIRFDTNTFVLYDRFTSFAWDWYINSMKAMNLSATGLTLDNLAFGLTYSGVDPQVTFKPTEQIRWSVANNRFEFIVGSTVEATASASGMAIANGLYVGAVTGIPTDNKVYAEGDIEAGVYLRTAGGRVYFGTDDYLNFDGTNLDSLINGASELRLSSLGLAVTNGLYVGSLTGTPVDNAIIAEGVVKAGTYLQVGSTTVLDTGDGNFLSGLAVGYDGNPLADTVMVGDALFGLNFVTANQPRLYFDTDDYLQYDRANPLTSGFTLVQDGTFLAGFRRDATFGNIVLGGCGLFTSTLHNPAVTGTAYVLNANTSPFCLASCAGDGTLLTNTYWNVSNMSHTIGSGIYYFNFTNQRLNSVYTPSFASVEGGMHCTVDSDQTTYIRVYTYGNAHTFADPLAVHVVVYDSQS